jgi:hypothetical protein
VVERDLALKFVEEVVGAERSEDSPRSKYSFLGRIHCGVEKQKSETFVLE